MSKVSMQPHSPHLCRTDWNSDIQQVLIHCGPFFQQRLITCLGLKQTPNLEALSTTPGDAAQPLRDPHFSG